MICTGCGHEVRFPSYVGDKPYHFLCARKVQGDPEPHDPVWLRRSKDRSLNPRGLAKDLTGVG